MCLWGAAGLLSCEKTTEGLTGITYYPVIELNGDTEIIYIGEEYVEPGYTAVMNGEDITDQVTTTNNVDNTTVGIYTVNYSAVNEQGFAASVSREVYVVSEGSIENLYYAVSNGQDGGIVAIYDNGDGTYLVTDICGGYYSYYRYPGYDAYGYDFYAEANFTLADDGTLTQVGDANNWYFGDPSDPSSMENGHYDETTGEVSWNMAFSGEAFLAVNLYPIEK